MAAFTVIDHTELSSTTTSWSESSISSSYDHLYLVASARGAAVAYVSNLWIRVGNGGVDTSSVYEQEYLYASSGTPYSNVTTGADKWAYQYVGADAVLADTFGTVEIWIPNYANTVGYKQAWIQTRVENNTTTGAQWWISNVAGLWKSTSAITDFELSEPNNGFKQYSTFTLYGVTG